MSLNAPSGCHCELAKAATECSLYVPIWGANSHLWVIVTTNSVKYKLKFTSA